MKIKKFLFVFGTRPEAIKLAPLIKIFSQQKSFNIKICSTGQHKQMLEDVLKVFNIKTDYDLNIMKKYQSLNDITIRILKEFPKILKEFNPDYVIVHGDTTTAFSAALSSFYSKIKIIHIESGLRTSSINEPYPEELNRRLISKIANYHFPPTQSAKANLVKEGVNKKNILITGNTVIDSLKLILKKLENKSEITDSFFREKKLNNLRKSYAVLTVHRKENQGKNIKILSQLLNEFEAVYPDLNFIFPIHLNPDLRKNFFKNVKTKNVIFIEPLNYLEFVILLKNSIFIMTDSGGIQEEAPTLNKKVIVLREESERKEIYNSNNFITGINPIKIKKAIDSILKNACPNKITNPFGDGKASIKILNFIIKHG